jgi:hypothetical protein
MNYFYMHTLSISSLKASPKHRLLPHHPPHHRQFGDSASLCNQCRVTVDLGVVSQTLVVNESQLHRNNLDQLCASGFDPDLHILYGGSKASSSQNIHDFVFGAHSSPIAITATVAGATAVAQEAASWMAAANPNILKLNSL